MQGLCVICENDIDFTVSRNSTSLLPTAATPISSSSRSFLTFNLKKFSNMLPCTIPCDVLGETTKPWTKTASEPNSCYSFNVSWLNFVSLKCHVAKCSSTIQILFFEMQSTLTVLNNKIHTTVHYLLSLFSFTWHMENRASAMRLHSRTLLTFDYVCTKTWIDWSAQKTNSQRILFLQVFFTPSSLNFQSRSKSPIHHHRPPIQAAMNTPKTVEWRIKHSIQCSWRRTWNFEVFKT